MLYAVDLTSYSGGSFYPRFTYATDSVVSNGGWYIDDVKVDYGSSCSTTTSSPGAVQNNLHIEKSGTDLTLTWTAPGGACVTSDYGVYRGNLPWTGYNHSYYICSTGGATSVIIGADQDSYYYVVVAQHDGKESSYGKDSTGNERPTAVVPCSPQLLGTCN